jgi:hypothetical protein
MPEPQFQAPLAPATEGRVTPRNQRTDARPSRDEADLALVREKLRQIAAHAEAGRLSDGREAIADLLFDFQPIIAAHADLVSSTLGLLGRCEATALLRRFRVAIYGDAEIGPARVRPPSVPLIPSRRTEVVKTSGHGRT